MKKKTLMRKSRKNLSSLPTIPKLLIQQSQSIKQIATPNVFIPKAIGSYDIKEKIADGSSSVVMKAICQNTKQVYACKIIPKKNINPNCENDLENRLRIFMNMSHVGLAQLYEYLKDEENYYLITEFCPYPSLFNYILKRGKVMEFEAKSIFLQVLHVIKHIHNYGFGHNDINTEHIMINDDKRVKLISYGLSYYMNAEENIGSYYFKSPEVIEFNEYRQKGDIWSLGVILYSMLVGRIPWTKTGKDLLLQQIEAREFFIPTSISPNVRDLINGTMENSEIKRLSISEIEIHPWLEKVPLTHFYIGASSSTKVCSMSKMSLCSFKGKIPIPTFSQSTRSSWGDVKINRDLILPTREDKSNKTID